MADMENPVSDRVITDDFLVDEGWDRSFIKFINGVAPHKWPDIVAADRRTRHNPIGDNAKAVDDAMGAELCIAWEAHRRLLSR